MRDMGAGIWEQAHLLSENVCFRCQEWACPGKGGGACPTMVKWGGGFIGNVEGVVQAK